MSEQRLPVPAKLHAKSKSQPLNLSHPSSRSLNPSIDAMIILLNDPKLSPAFHTSLHQQYGTENSDFYLLYKSMQGSSKELSKSEMDVKVRWVLGEFVEEGSARQLNLPEPMVRRLRILAEKKEEQIEFEVLASVFQECMRMIYDNNYGKFIASIEAKAVLEGKVKLSRRTSDVGKRSFVQRVMSRFRFKQ